jgi:hypothetical protein
MGHQVVFERCSTPTWSECENHVEHALAGVAPSERCTCDQGFAGSSAASTEAAVARYLGAES